MKNLTRTFENIKTTVSLDLRALAFFRILLGILILVDLLIRSKHLEMFYTNFGVLPINQLYEKTSILSTFSLHIASDSLAFQIFMFILAAVFAFCLIAGYKTTLMTLLSWILLVSLQNRNPTILQGGDVVFRMMLFFAIFLPLGARYSLDSLKKDRYIISNKHSNLATFSFILQIVFVYFFSALLKEGAEWRSEFTSIYYTLELDLFVTSFGEFIKQFYELTKILTAFVWHFELLVGILILLPIKNWIFRTVGILGLIGMHLGISSTIDVGLFSAIMIVYLIGLLPTGFIDKISTTFEKIFINKTKIIEFDSNNQKHLLYIRILKVFFALKKVEFKNKKVKRITVISYNNKNIGFNALIEILDNSLIFFPFVLFQRFFIFKQIFNKSLKFISIFRVNIRGSKSSEENENIFIYFIINLTTAFVITCCLLWNLANSYDSIQIDRTMDEIMRFFRFDQYWNMFSPYPLKEDGWFIVTGTLTNGAEVNLFGTQKESKYDRPKDISEEFETQRDRKYIMNLWSTEFVPHRDLYFDYLCRKWNTKSDVPIKSVTMEYMLEISQPRGVQTTVNNVNMGSYNCM